MVGSESPQMSASRGDVISKMRYVRDNTVRGLKRRHTHLWFHGTGAKRKGSKIRNLVAAKHKQHRANVGHGLRGHILPFAPLRKPKNA